MVPPLSHFRCRFAGNCRSTVCSISTIPKTNPGKEAIPFGGRNYIHKKKRFNCHQMPDWLVVWNILFFSIYWECHHPNWLSYFSEGLKPPTSWNIFSWGNFLWTALNLDQGSQVFLLFSQSWALCWWLQGGGFSGVAWHRQRHPGMGLHLALKTKCEPRSSSKYFISWKLVNWVNKLS